MNRTQKAEAIQQIADRLSSTSTVIAAEFHGLSVREVEDLRGRLRVNGWQLQVVKNTLARRACAEAGTDALLEYLVGQTALVWAEGDAAPVAKVLNDFGTATDNRLSMKGAILDGAPISGAEMKRLAALPPRDELLARLVGGVASPLQGTVNALSSLLSGMARALGAYQAQRAAEAPAEAVAPEPTEATAAEEAPTAGDAPSAKESTEDTPAAEATPAADDSTDAEQQSAVDDTADAEPAADQTTEGD